MKVENVIRAYLPEETGYSADLAAAMNYSILAGGKRLRPSMLWETYRLFRGDAFEPDLFSPAAPFMAAMEMIHTYSLVHDDLPAMDNDVLRRGKTTTWKQFGEAQGILAGDALLTYAFETAVKAFALTDDSGRVYEALGILAQKAGIGGMCGGQAVDVAMEGKAIPSDMLNYIYENKTGALFEAAMMIGAKLGGADAAEVEICRKAASKIGLAFQIRDDILDMISTEAELGKTIGSDAANGKYTYASVHGPEAAQNAVAKLSKEALELLETLPGDKTYFCDLIRKMETRKN